LSIKIKPVSKETNITYSWNSSKKKDYLKKDDIGFNKFEN